MNKYKRDTDNGLLRAQQTADELVNRGIDLTTDYDNWVRIAFSLAELGEDGLPIFQKVSSLHPKYNPSECEKHFRNCLRTRNGSVTLGTFFQLATNAGVSITMKLGRRFGQKAKAEKEAETPRERNARIHKEKVDLVLSTGPYRYNTCMETLEKMMDGKWEPVTDAVVSSICSSLREEGYSTTSKFIWETLQTEEYVPHVNIITEYFERLLPWDETRSSCIDSLMNHLVIKPSDSVQFQRDMLRKWFVRNVALMLGKVEENDIMPVFCGKEDIGKTYFCKQLLPHRLRSMFVTVKPDTPTDKDYTIMLSQKSIILMDEFNIGRNSGAMKALLSMNESYVRAAYAHIALQRKRMASLIGTSNEMMYIPDENGSRRFLSINVIDTVNFNEHPVDIDSAYAEAVHLINLDKNNYTFTHEEKMRIKELNVEYLEPDAAMDAIQLVCHKPSNEEMDQSVLVTASEILRKMKEESIPTNELTVIKISKALPKMGITPIENGKNTKKFRIVWGESA